MEVKEWKGKYQTHSTLISLQSQVGSIWDTQAIAYRSHNLESVLPAYREMRLAVEIVSAKLEGAKFVHLFLLIHLEDSAEK